MKVSSKIICRGQVFRAEEKAPFVISGLSIHGAIEYDEKAETVKCHECGSWVRSIGAHLVKHGIPSRAYRLAHGINIGSSISAPSVAARRAALTLAAHGKNGLRNGNRFSSGIKGKRSIGRTRAELRNERGMCRAQLIAKIKSIADDLGHSPSIREVGRGIHGSAVKLFGSWSKLMMEADIEPNKQGKASTYSVPILIELLRDFCVLNKRPPKRSDWDSGSLPDRDTYTRYFGSIQAAMEAVGMGNLHDARRRRVA